MTKSNLLVEAVANGYLNGKSFDQIAIENSMAKGSVHNIIRAWINHIGIPDIDELREFSVMVRKSGITIKQCAQSFRFIQILANFGIKDEIDMMPKNEGKNDYHGLSHRDNYYYFIESLYNNCNKTGIKSTDIVGWMQDLIDFSSLLFENIDNSKIRLEEDTNEIEEMENLSNNKKLLYRKPADTSNNETKVQIPLISEISGYIEQKKLEVQQLNIKKKTLLQEKGELEEQKNIISSKIINLKEKESSALIYLDWYKNLKKELLNNHKINLDDEFNNFVKVIADFKYYDYDAHQIIKEYKEMESLKIGVKLLNGIVTSIEKTRDETLKELESLGEKETYLKQSLNALDDLTDAGFGLKELKQLKNTVYEIATSNDIDYYDVPKKFFTDIETQYDSKLGFESKIIELEAKLKKLEDEVPGYKERLQSQFNALGALQYLYKFGVTDEDIINMTAIVIAYLKGHIIFNPDLQPENMIEKNKLMKKTDYWKLFISEIKNLGDVNSQTANRRSYLEVIKKEIDRLYLQRQKLNEETLKSGQSLNSLNSQLSSFIEFTKQFIMFSVNNANKKTLFVYQPLFFVNVTTNGDFKDDSNINLNDKGT